MRGCLLRVPIDLFVASLHDAIIGGEAMYYGYCEDQNLTSVVINAEKALGFAHITGHYDRSEVTRLR